ncbi:hypothetical protein BGZ58_004373, partial [Dissophora ornata]
IYAHAQAFNPLITGFANTVYIEGKGMFLRGGSQTNYFKDVTQTFMINLTVSWPIGKPAYHQLSNGPADVTTGSALTADKKNWVITGNDTSYIYNFNSMQWTDSTPNTAFLPPNTYGSATDPKTGLMYIGMQIGESDNGLVAFSNSGFVLQNVSVAYTNVPYMVRYHIAWSDKLKRILMFGGSPDAGSPYTNNVSPTFDGQLYDPTTGTVTTFAATGDIPPNRFEACFVPFNNGSKVALYGGAAFANSTPFVNDIYILDVPSRRWTRGPDAVESRGASACAVSNNQLIVWGGFTPSQVFLTPALVYDLKANKWTKGFTAPGPCSAPWLL